jgi:hypothetical protein
MNLPITAVRNPKNFLPALSALALAMVFEVLNGKFSSPAILTSLGESFAVLLLL